MKSIILLILFSGSYCFADLLKDFDSLGSNKVLLEKAQVLAPEKQIQIVQGRVVNRVRRHEFLTSIEAIQEGGNSYIDTRLAGLNYQYHLTPYWSVGLNYGYAFNELSSEGEKVIAEGRDLQDQIISEDPNSTQKIDPFIPELNWIEQSLVAQVNWYPIYGKFKFLNKSIVHFDIYTQLGAGQVELRKSNSTIYQAGLGIGFWWSQHLTSRLEYKYSTYDAEHYKEDISVEMSSLNFSVGYLL